MVRAVLLIILLFVTGSAGAQSPQAISGNPQFFTGSLSALDSQARQQGKPYIVEVKTSWCSVCRMFDRTTLSDAQVQQMLAQSFLFTQLDAEQGQGIDFAKKHKIKAYPAILFFYPDGKLMGKINSYQDPEFFYYNLQRLYKKFRNKQSKS